MTIIRRSHSAMVRLGECVHSYETSGQAPRYTISASVTTVEMTCASRQIPIEFDSTKVFPLPLIFNAFEKVSIVPGSRAQINDVFADKRGAFCFDRDLGEGGGPQRRSEKDCHPAWIGDPDIVKGLSI